MSERAALTAIIRGARAAGVLEGLVRGIERLIARPVELLVVTRAGEAIAPGPWRAVAHDGTVPAARNAALAAARTDRCVFLDAEGALESSFLAQASRALDRRPDVALVTAWVDGVAARADSVERALGIGDLLARPWFAHVPSLVRRAAWERAGGFDEALAGCDDVDFLLRVALDGGVVLGVGDARLPERAWGAAFDWEHEGAHAAARRLFDKHRRVFEAHWEAALFGKERVVRELYTARAPEEERVRTLDREAASLARARAHAEAGLARVRR